MSTSLREEMISLSLFGGKLALAELILFSVFLTDILQGALPLAAQRFEAGDRGGYHAIVTMSLLLGGGMAVLVLLAVVIALATSTAVIVLRLRLRMPGDAA